MIDPAPDSDAAAGRAPVQPGHGEPGGGATDPAADAALSHVVDDTDGRDEAAEWAAGELLRGRPFEDVSADLVGRGWPAEAAGRIVEAAREATRRDRGVRTREDVARGVARRYARSVRLVRWLVILGIVAVAVIGSMFLRG